MSSGKTWPKYELNEISAYLKNSKSILGAKLINISLKLN